MRWKLEAPVKGVEKCPAVIFCILQLACCRFFLNTVNKKNLRKIHFRHAALEQLEIDFSFSLEAPLRMFAPSALKLYDAWSQVVSQKKYFESKFLNFIFATNCKLLFNFLPFVLVRAYTDNPITLNLIIFSLSDVNLMMPCTLCVYPTITKILPSSHRNENFLSLLLSLVAFSKLFPSHYSFI